MDEASRHLFFRVGRWAALSLAITLILCLGAFFLVRSEHLSFFEVSGDSMLPGYHNGEFLIVKHSSKLQNGQIVFFHPPQGFSTGLHLSYNLNKSTFVKRVAAIPGQMLAYRGGSFYVNGKLIYSNSSHHYACLQAPKSYSRRLVNQIFVLGENSQVSLDSRRAFCDGAANFLVPLSQIIDQGSIFLHS